MTATTIKIPVELRDRVRADAKAHGQTIAARLEQLIAGAEREARFAAVRHTHAHARISSSGA